MSSASSVLAPAAAITAMVSSPQVPMSSGYGSNVVQSPQPSAGQLPSMEVEDMEGVMAKGSRPDGLSASSEVSGSEIAPDPNLADSSEGVAVQGAFGTGIDITGPESSTIEVPSLDQDDKRGVADEEMDALAMVPQEGVAMEGQEEPMLKPADTTQAEGERGRPGPNFIDYVLWLHFNFT